MQRRNDMIGIYKILNKVTGKFYIGSSSKSIENRWNIHKWHLRRNNHHNPKLQSAWNKYGEDNFEFSIIELTVKENCIDREQFFIDSLKPFFNIREKAESQLGLKRFPETLLKLSRAKRGQKYSVEARKNMGLSHIGFRHREESKRKMSIVQKGLHKKISLEQRKIIAEANKKRIWTPEARRKIGEVTSKRKLSKEHIEAIRYSRLNYWANKRRLGLCVAS